MRTKDLEKQIKTESQKVIVPSVLEDLKAHISTLPTPNKEIDIIQSRRFNFRLPLQLGLSFLLVFFISVAFIQTSNADPLNDDSIVEAVALSTITTATIGSEELLSYQMDDVILLVGGNGNQHNNDTEATEIETEVNHLTTYLPVIENMIAQTKEIQVQKERVRRLSNRYKMTFNTSNLDDESSAYVVEYENIEKNDNHYQLEGTVLRDDTTYQLDLSYDSKNNQISTRMSINDNQSVEVQFENGEKGYTYQIRRILNDQVYEEATISFKNKRQIILEFNNSQATGTYQFSIATTELGRKYLNIGYDMSGNRGQMAVMVNILDRSKYNISVTPEGGETVVFTKDRGRSRK